MCHADGRAGRRSTRAVLPFVSWLWRSISAIPAGSSEVAVDLEGRMRVEEVRVGGFFEEGSDVFQAFVAHAESGVEVDDPCPAPAV